MNIEMRHADLVRDIIKSFINNGFNPSTVFAGIHNAFVFGEVLLDNGYELDENDKILGELFEGFDKCLEAIEKIKP